MPLIAYTDGGCRGNPGVGAWAFILVDPATKHCLERADGEARTTNNRMEMTAAIEAMRALRQPDSELVICSDSKYLIDCCTQWMPGWKRKGWKKKGGELKNVDLLQILDDLLAKHRVTWQWVKGHAGHPGNERADWLLNQAMDRLANRQTAGHEARGTWPHPIT